MLPNTKQLKDYKDQMKQKMHKDENRYVNYVQETNRKK